MKRIFKFFVLKTPCKHLFKANEMQPRDETGNVRWVCSKCGKLFTAHCGLDILAKGTCDGRWDLPNEYINAKIELGYDKWK
jgi:hypothetical protein